MLPSRDPRRYVYQLRLRRPPRASRGNLARTILLVRLDRLSWGEAVPSPRLGETQRETAEALDQMMGDLAGRAEGSPEELAAWFKERFPLCPSARAAMEMAVFDAAARRHEQPLHRFLRLPAPAGAPSSYTICLGADEAELEERLEEARAFPALKVRCGGPAEAALGRLKLLARQTDKPLRIDAGGGWTLAETQAILPALARLNIDYLEQPLGPHSLQETAALLRECPVPILLGDEIFGSPILERLLDCCNGFVVRLMSCGGLSEALRMIRRGRDLGFQIALDSTLETSLAATAAAHLAGAVDYVNLSAPLLLENDPFRGVSFAQGRLVLPEAPGLGVELCRQAEDQLHLAMHLAPGG